MTILFQPINFPISMIIFLFLVFNETWDTTQSCILHSDQDLQYTNVQYLRKLDAYGVTISHSGRGNCYDNACCENFFSHLKSESLSLHKPETRDELIQQIGRYIQWYNFGRPQEKLKGMPLWNSGSHTFINNVLFYCPV